MSRKLGRENCLTETLMGEMEKKEERQNDQGKGSGVREVQGRVDSDRRRLITAMKKGDTKSGMTAGKKATLETKKEMEERAN